MSYIYNQQRVQVFELDQVQFEVLSRPSIDCEKCYPQNKLIHHDSDLLARIKISTIEYIFKYNESD